MFTGNTVKVLHTERFHHSFYKPPSISWSEDNSICIPSEEGVHIYEPKLGTVDESAALTVIYVQKVITPPEEVNVFGVEVDRQFLHNHLPTEYISDLMLDRTLSPLVACKPSYKGYCVAKWSPRGIGPHKSCVLATLAMDHRLSLYAYRDGSWKLVAELSTLYYEHMKSNLLPYTADESISNSENAVKMLKKFATEVYSLSAVEIEWTHKYCCNNSDSSDGELHSSNSNIKCGCILIVGMKDGSLVFWSAASPCTESDLMIISSLETDLDCISSVKWQKISDKTGLLAVGSKKGKGKLYKCVIETLETLHLVFEELSILWEFEDGMPLENLCWNMVNSNAYHLLASKNAYYLGWVIEDMAVKYSKYIYHDSYLSVSGICKFENKFIAAPVNKPVAYVTFTLEPEFSISTDSVSQCLETNDTINYGIGCSPSGAMLCLLQMLGVQYDNRVAVEPISITYFTFLTPEDIKTFLSGKFEDFSAIKDILTCFCLLCQPDNKMNLCESLFELIPKDNLVNQSTSHLMLYRWLLNFMTTNKNPQNTLLYSELDTLLLMRHLTALVKSHEFMELQNTTYDGWKMRVGVICQYIMKNSKISKHDEIIEFLEKFAPFEEFAHETCQICHLELDDVEVAKCQNKHVFGRCCLSLVAIGAHYRKCSGCSSTASVTALALCFETNSRRHLSCMTRLIRDGEQCKQLLETLKHVCQSRVPILWQWHPVNGVTKLFYKSYRVERFENSVCISMSWCSKRCHKLAPVSCRAKNGLLKNRI